MDERPIPPAALRDENAVEMLRVWIAERQLHCSLKIGMYRETNIEEDEAWGTILADAARHIAAALSVEGPDTETVLVHNIRARFNAELDAPTSTVRGGFVDS